MKAYHITLWTISLLLVLGCASSGQVQHSGNRGNARNTLEVDNSTLALADYLQRLPGVQVNGSGGNVKVTVRGAASFIAGTDPLYVVDGQAVGTSYAQVASIVSVYNIERIKVLKGSDAAIYGVRGGNGVILITTKH